MAGKTDPTRPLSGVRILDLSRVLAGPYGTMILADLGADVIKVERPQVGDDLRKWGPVYTSDGESAYFLAVNRNKQSITIDLKQPRGKEILIELACRSDVLVENFRSGTMDDLGIGYAALSSRNPRLIYCSLTAYGVNGPYRNLPGYDIIIQAMGGLMSVTGEPNGPPLRAGIAIIDVLAGVYLAVGVLGALEARRRDGHGQRLELSLLGVELASLVNVAANYLVAGQVANRIGNAHPSVAPYEVFEAGDGWVAVAVATENQWLGFTKALERDDLRADARFRSNADRVRNRAVLNQVLAGVFRERPKDDWVATLRAADVPCGPVNSIDQILTDPHVVQESIIQEVRHPTAGRLRIIGSPLKLSGNSTEPVLPPPRLGEDTERILGTVLQMTPTQISALRADGIV
jgi:formyl-CoA transferase